MTFPQPSSTEYLFGGQDFFRLNTPLQSPGDIYESDVSCHGFCIGPDSDISQVQVNYFDNQVASSRLNGFIITPDRAFQGRIDARLDATYPQLPGNRTARILMSSADIYDPTYRPEGFNVANDALDFIVPRFDVIQYFKNMPSVVPTRSDKKYDWKYYDTIPGIQWIIVPYYGRKYAMLDLENWDPLVTAEVQLRGVNFTVSADAEKHIETALIAPTPILPDGAGLRFFLKASTHGMFDALVIGVDDNPGPMPMRLLVSDDPL
jgi:hypothetical protein